MKNIYILGIVAAACLLSCAKKTETTASGLIQDAFTAVIEGKPIALYVLKNASGAEACITNYGGRIVSLMVPDRNGKPTDVVLGYDNIAAYLSSMGNYGALIGRYGNRIAKGKFTLDGVEYQLPQNNNGNCLHGGPNGFHRQIWEATQTDAQTLLLKYISEDGDAGFPGKLTVTVTYTLSDDNALGIKYEAVTEIMPTVLNLTNHSYFNLSGVAGSDILDHIVTINADSLTAVDSTMIPCDIIAVEGTPLDFRTPTPVGLRIDSDYEQLALGRGYDHNWVLNTKGDVNQLAAKAVSPVSGITMEVYTNEPGVQLYTGNAMNGRDTGKFGVVYPRRGALCFETQHYPDSPNHPQFPSTVLRPGETYLSICIYKFSVTK